MSKKRRQYSPEYKFKVALEAATGSKTLAQIASETSVHPNQKAGIRISMDGRGRALDNIFIERLWRSVKYEDVYLKDYGSVPELKAGLQAYFRFYNEDRPHQSLGYRTPAEVHRA